MKRAALVARRRALWDASDLPQTGKDWVATAVTLAVSTAVLARELGGAEAVGVELLLLVHEMGHWFYAGAPASPSDRRCLFHSSAHLSGLKSCRLAPFSRRGSRWQAL